MSVGGKEAVEFFHTLDDAGRFFRRAGKLGSTAGKDARRYTACRLLALLHFQSPGALQRRALTGLFST